MATSKVTTARLGKSQTSATSIGAPRGQLVRIGKMTTDEVAALRPMLHGILRLETRSVLFETLKDYFKPWPQFATGPHALGSPLVHPPDRISVVSALFSVGTWAATTPSVLSLCDAHRFERMSLVYLDKDYFQGLAVAQNLKLYASICYFLSYLHMNNLYALLLAFRALRGLQQIVRC